MQEPRKTDTAECKTAMQKERRIDLKKEIASKAASLQNYLEFFTVSRLRFQSEHPSLSCICQPLLGSPTAASLGRPEGIACLDVTTAGGNALLLRDENNILYMCDDQNSLCAERSWVSPSRVVSPHTALAPFYDIWMIWMCSI